MRTLILDAETDTLNKGVDAVGKFLASPFYKDNHIVNYGIKEISSETTAIFRGDMETGKLTLGGAKFGKPEDVVMVGQNIKFDFLYMMKENMEFLSEWFPYVTIWDCQLAEYILTGQSEQYASLNKMAAKYGGTQKPDRIKEYWDAGVATRAIPEKELDDYLKGDVENTQCVYERQLHYAEKLGMMPLMTTQMAGLKATIMMEWNGMHFDKEMAERLGSECLSQVETLKDSLKQQLNAAEIFNPYFVENEFNAGSPQQIALALFGGAYKYDIKVPDLDANGIHKRFKSGLKVGELRYVKKTKEKHTDGFRLTAKSKYNTESGKIGVGTDVLKDILAQSVGKVILPHVRLINTLLEYRKLQKDYKTYYVGYGDLTWQDGCIHPSLCHVGTDTGRLSCSKPNVQNATQTEDH